MLSVCVFMIESGFSLFFLLIAIGGLVVLASTAHAHWTRIVAALRGEVASVPVTTYRISLRRPMDLPRVAKRLQAGRPRRNERRTLKADGVKRA